MSDYLLDTNILILALRGHSGALDFLLALEREEKRAFISGDPRGSPGGDAPA